MWISVRCLRQHTHPCHWRSWIMSSQPYPWRRCVPDHRARYMNGCAFSAPMQTSACRHTQMRQHLWWHTWLPSRICQSAMVGMPGVSMMKNLDESVPCRPRYWTVFISYHRATLYTACVLGGHLCCRCPKKTRNSHTAVVQQRPWGTAHRTTQSDAAPARGRRRSALATATWHDTSAETTAGAKCPVLPGRNCPSLSLSDKTCGLHKLHISKKKVNYLLYFQVKQCSQTRVKTITAELNAIPTEGPWDIIGVDMDGSFTKNDSGSATFEP